jgi:hypothetical protein
MWSWKYPDVSHKKPGVGAVPPLVLSRPPWAWQAAMGFARIRVAKPLLISPGPGVPEVHLGYSPRQYGPPLATSCEAALGVRPGQRDLAQRVRLCGRSGLATQRDADAKGP